MRSRLYWAIGCLLCFQGALVACRSHADPATEVGPSEPMAPMGETLPPLELRGDTPNLLLTWVGEDGDFHVVESIDAIPVERRNPVRVVVIDHSAGTGQAVYVADFSARREDGTYAVTTLGRADWEKLGADLRKTRMEALAPDQDAKGAAPAGADSTRADPDGLGAAISAIVYGADWCKPCHDAERYLKSLGVSVTKKNIEESRAAQAEMQEKLVRVNRGGASIPVIDVMGKIFVGYSPGHLKKAVDAAKHAAVQKRG